ncbi:insulinase family protein [Treponema parvum]|uniref:insulinase family protein n=1 Tax=Treponema parvum TaxID=138851 RepID=UPI001AEBA688|nr:insulinase family protein [Treponema parvum]QTQ16490.1 insulinase family protein [Treponema parvum]
MKFTSDSKYKNWTVISVRDIPDCASSGIYLRHKGTGLEVFHLLNDDEENLFAFSFRTPPEDSAGEAHILEHSVLCGSQKYPLKDPFVRLINQSIKTFLNAMTFPDKTVFPASSQVKADYFNLMSVYGDAVFFPRLDPEIFLQEAHRLEIDKNGNYSIQGVVYNEMKGNYSSFDSVAGDAAVKSLFPNTVYSLDSGGDPLIIPNITHAKLKNFHEKYYRTDNCLVFLYGNIPTEEQLDFIEKEFLHRIEKQTFDETEIHSSRAQEKFSLDAVLSRETVSPFSKPIFVEEKGPSSANNTHGATVMENWLLCPSCDLKSYMECIFLSEVICGHDGSPLTRTLLESGLGEDIAPNSGLYSEMHDLMFTVGLRGVESSNIREVERLIFKTLNELSSGEIPKSDIDSALMSVNFANREVRRAGGPYSLVLLRRALRAWNYGKEPADMLLVRETFAKLEEQILSSPGYVSELIKKYLIANMHRSLVSVIPDEQYAKERSIFEQTIIELRKKSKMPETVMQENEKLHAFQQKAETEKDIKCLPHLSPSDLPAKIDRIVTKQDYVESKNGDIPLFINKEETNGIVYADIAFPLDVISNEDYPLIPLFSIAVTNCGWKGKTWAETAGLTAMHCGGFEATTITSSVPPKCKKSVYTGRDMIIFRVKMLKEKTEDALKLVSDCLCSTDFSDVKRLQDLLNEYRNDLDESVIPSGHSFCAIRAERCVNRSKAVDEVWNGLSQLFEIHKINEVQKLTNRFNSMLEKIKKGGTVLHITADDESLKYALPKLKDFVKYAGLTAIGRAPESAKVGIASAFSDFSANLNGEQARLIDDEPTRRVDYTSASGKRKPDIEIFTTRTEVGFSAQAFPASGWLTKESAAETVLAHWLSTTVLWEQLRTIGGAYGAYASSDPIEGTFSFTSYRDPDPLKTAESLLEFLKKTAVEISGKDGAFGKETLKKAVVGCYSKEIQPQSPGGRGFTGFLRCLYGITEKDREHKIKLLFSVTERDVKNALDRLVAQSEKCTKVCITGDAKDSSGKIMLLPI